MQVELGENYILSGSDDKVVKKMSVMLEYQPQYKHLLNPNVIQNIYSFYESMILKERYPIFEADKWSEKTAHFTRLTWRTINELTKRTGLPKAFILTYAEAVYILGQTGKIPISVINPRKKKEGVKKFFESLGNFGKYGIPIIAASAGLIALSYLTSQKKRFSYG